jgi:hypothetical protein
MKKEEIKLGMTVRIVKDDESSSQGWAPGHSHHLKLLATVEQIHPDLDAINLKIIDPNIKEAQNWWYHAGDLQKYEIPKCKTKKELFDLNNLIMGV